MISSAPLEAAVASAAVRLPAESFAWRGLSVTRTGSRHLRDGNGCDDWGGIRLEAANSAMAACACDGAGSYEGTGLGAAAIGEAFLGRASSDSKMAVEDPRALLRDCTETAADSVDLAAFPKAMCATFAGVMVSQKQLTAWQVGDGLIIARIAGVYGLLGARHRGEYANETVFLDGPEKVEAASITAIEVDAHAQPVRLAIATDGLANLLLERDTPRADLLDVLFEIFEKTPEDAFRETLGDFLDSELVRNASDDDLTLVLACTQPSARE